MTGYHIWPAWLTSLAIGTGVQRHSIPALHGTEGHSLINTGTDTCRSRFHSFAHVNQKSDDMRPTTSVWKASVMTTVNDNK